MESLRRCAIRHAENENTHGATSRRRLPACRARAAARGATVGDEVVEALQRLQTDQDQAALAVARARMGEMFRTVKGFRLAPRIPREELYERGSLR